MPNMAFYSILEKTGVVTFFYGRRGNCPRFLRENRGLLPDNCDACLVPLSFRKAGTRHASQLSGSRPRISRRKRGQLPRLPKKKVTTPVFDATALPGAGLLHPVQIRTPSWLHSSTRNRTGESNDSNLLSSILSSSTPLPETVHFPPQSDYSFRSCSSSTEHTCTLAV